MPVPALTNGEWVWPRAFNPPVQVLIGGRFRAIYHQPHKDKGNRDSRHVLRLPPAKALVLRAVFRWLGHGWLKPH